MEFIALILPLLNLFLAQSIRAGKEWSLYISIITMLSMIVFGALIHRNTLESLQNDAVDAGVAEYYIIKDAKTGEYAESFRYLGEFK